LAIRSLLETVACQHLISRREYVPGATQLRQAYRGAEALAAKLHTMRKTVAPDQPWLREAEVLYEVKDDE
jgi:hypothetical protein